MAREYQESEGHTIGQTLAAGATAGVTRRASSDDAREGFCSMDRLWAPWRSSYIVTAALHEDAECIFCAKLADDNDQANYVVRREELCFALLNLYPYNNGHLLVAPNRHVGEVEELTEGEMLALFRLTRTMIGALRRAMNPDGFNVGVNLGRVAGAGVPGHFHIHIVPRWNGDTSFMPVLSDTKVISQSLEEAYRRLRAALLEEGGVMAP